MVANILPDPMSLMYISVVRAHGRQYLPDPMSLMYILVVRAHGRQYFTWNDVSDVHFSFTGTWSAISYLTRCVWCTCILPDPMSLVYISVVRSHDANIIPDPMSFMYTFQLYGHMIANILPDPMSLMYISLVRSHDRQYLTWPDVTDVHFLSRDTWSPVSYLTRCLCYTFQLNGHMVACLLPDPMSVIYFSAVRSYCRKYLTWPYMSDDCISLKVTWSQISTWHDASDVHVSWTGSWSPISYLTRCLWCTF